MSKTKKVNEYKVNDTEEPIVVNEPSVKKKKSQKKRKDDIIKDEKESPTEQKRINILKPLHRWFAEDNRRTNLTTGSLLVLFSIYQLLSFVS